MILNACHTGVAEGQSASFAHALLDAGAEAVFAMQTSVSDHYATQLAKEFFEALAGMGRERPAAALAMARRVLESRRQQEKQRSEAAAPALPEYATATLFVRGASRDLVDFRRDREPLRARTVLELSSPVPQLRLDDLIGRRRELRDTLRTLRTPPQGEAGVVLIGIGGIGKSAVAGRAMRRLVESGFAVAAVTGKWDVQRISEAIGVALAEAALAAGKAPAGNPTIASLTNPALPDSLRWPLLLRVMATEPIVLVLDDFEQNLTTGGEHYRDPDLPTFIAELVANAKRGRLLITCRYPIPGERLGLRPVPLGPLSPAEVRKLLQRLPSLRDRPSQELIEVVRTIGGHPRMLEFLDALLAGGVGRLPHVTARLKAALAHAGLAAGATIGDVSEALQQTIVLGTRDVFLEELVAIAQANDTDAVLLQVAVSNLPVSASGVAHTLADAPPKSAATARVVSALEQLERLSLVVRLGDEGY